MKVIVVEKFYDKTNYEIVYNVGQIIDLPKDRTEKAIALGLVQAVTEDDNSDGNGYEKTVKKQKGGGK
jgi:hypothetical protein